MLDAAMVCVILVLADLVFEMHFEVVYAIINCFSEKTKGIQSALCVCARVRARKRQGVCLLFGHCGAGAHEPTVAMQDFSLRAPKRQFIIFLLTRR